MFFGDSITEQYDLNKFYEQMPVVNSGSSGYTTNDLLEIIQEDVYVFNPTKVVLLVGINDMNKTQDDLSIVENIKKITRIIKKRPVLPGLRLFTLSVFFLTSFQPLRGRTLSFQQR